MGCNHANHGDGCAHAHAESITELYPSLYPYIHRDAIQGYNESILGASKSVFKPNDQRYSITDYVESLPEDPMLLISIPFTASLKLMGIAIAAFPASNAPSHLKLYVNKPDLDLSSVDAFQPAQEISLARDHEILYYPLRF
jgi:hypothetical protein